MLSQKPAAARRNSPRSIVNAVILHCPEDGDRARWLGQAWASGRATLCLMTPQRRRIALGARSVLVGLWSNRSDSDGGGRQFADVLAHSVGRAVLVVWDGRPPLEAAAAAGVPVVIATEEPDEVLRRLERAAAALFEGRAISTDLGGKTNAAPARSRSRARAWGVAAGVVLGALLALGGLAPVVLRALQSSPASAESSP